MTAVAGFWSRGAACTAADPAASCTAMLAALHKYGPHHTAQWQTPSLAIGRCLYRLLPEDSFDTAPQISADGRFVLVADVRLDNRDELIAALGASAINPDTLCDAAILLAAFEHWDESCVDHLVGDFAFALWDGEQQRLILARDFLGQRPLYFHEGEGFFAFASMPKGLHALPAIARIPDEQQVADFLLAVPEYGASSFFSGIQRVATGHLAIVTAAGVTQRRYWQPQARTLPPGGTDACIDALRFELDRATRSRLRGCNGHVGAHLSGGLDSSAVAATAARLLTPLQGRVTAFTAVPRAGYANPSVKGRICDEGPLAAATAALHPAIEHVLVDGAGDSPLDGLDQAVNDFERPLLNLCNHGWLTSINRTARQRDIQVMLWGQFGNLGLSFDGTGLLTELVAAGQWQRWWREARAITGRRRMSWPSVLKASFGPWLPSLLWRLVHRRTRATPAGISRYCAINPRYLAAFNVVAQAQDRGADLAARPAVSSFDARVRAAQGVDLGFFSKGVLARWGIDLRDPTADRRLIEFSLSVPLHEYQSGGEMRLLARRALADRLPAEVLREWRKGLQGVDWHAGVGPHRQALSEELARLAGNERAARVVDIARLQRLLQQWPQAGWELPQVNLSYRSVLLRGLAAAHFLGHAGNSR